MSYLQDKKPSKEISKYPMDWSGNFGLSDAAPAFRLPRDEDGNVLAVGVVPMTSNSSSGVVTNNMPTSIVDPLPAPGSPNSAARCYGNPYIGGVTDATVGLVVNARQMGVTASGNWSGQLQNFPVRTVSAINTAGVTLLSTLNLNQGVAIDMQTSGGTATLTTEVSVDQANWIVLEVVAAAAHTAKNYDTAHLPATIALNPILFPYVRITAAAAGAGNTTTTTVSCK